jgi:RNA polymerase sigma-70 factor (ECF subfamily)
VAATSTSAIALMKHRRIGSASIAEDLFQETWLAAARHAHLLREDTAPLRWLYTIARNKHRNARRSWAMDSRRRAALYVAPRAEAPRPDEDAASRVEAERVRAAMDRLPEAYREVLVLCACEGLDSADAAEVLALPDRLAARTLARAGAHLEHNLRRTAHGRIFGPPFPAFAVPALLASAAVVLAVDTCVRVARIFGGS